MALTVDLMSRITSYVVAGSTVEQFIKDSNIPPADEAETKEYWDEMEQAHANLKPGEQIMVPGEWS